MLDSLSIQFHEFNGHSLLEKKFEAASELVRTKYTSKAALQGPSMNPGHRRSSIRAPRSKNFLFDTTAPMTMAWTFHPTRHQFWFYPADQWFGTIPDLQQVGKTMICSVFDPWYISTLNFSVRIVAFVEAPALNLCFVFFMPGFGSLKDIYMVIAEHRNPIEATYCHRGTNEIYIAVETIIIILDIHRPRSLP